MFWRTYVRVPSVCPGSRSQQQCTTLPSLPVLTHSCYLWPFPEPPGQLRGGSSLWFSLIIFMCLCFNIVFFFFSPEIEAPWEQGCEGHLSPTRPYPTARDSGSWEAFHQDFLNGRGDNPVAKLSDGFLIPIPGERLHDFPGGHTGSQEERPWACVQHFLWTRGSSLGQTLPGAFST